MKYLTKEWAKEYEGFYAQEGNAENRRATLAWLEACANKVQADRESVRGLTNEVDFDLFIGKPIQTLTFDDALQMTFAEGAFLLPNAKVLDCDFCKESAAPLQLLAVEFYPEEEGEFSYHFLLAQGQGEERSYHYLTVRSHELVIAS